MKSCKSAISVFRDIQSRLSVLLILNDRLSWTTTHEPLRLMKVFHPIFLHESFINSLQITKEMN